MIALQEEGPGLPSSLSSAPPVIPGIACFSMIRSPLSTTVTSLPTNVTSRVCHSSAFLAASDARRQEAIYAADVMTGGFEAEVVFRDPAPHIVLRKVDPAVAPFRETELRVEFEVRELLLARHQIVARDRRSSAGRPEPANRVSGG